MFALTPCFAHHMAVVVNKDVKVPNVTSAHLAKIFKGEVKKWPDGRNVVLVLAHFFVRRNGHAGASE